MTHIRADERTDAHTLQSWLTHFSGKRPRRRGDASRPAAVLPLRRLRNATCRGGRPSEPPRLQTCVFVRAREREHPRSWKGRPATGSPGPTPVTPPSLVSLQFCRVTLTKLVFWWRHLPVHATAGCSHVFSSLNSLTITLCASILYFLSLFI